MLLRLYLYLHQAPIQELPTVKPSIGPSYRQEERAVWQASGVVSAPAEGEHMRSAQRRPHGPHDWQNGLADERSAGTQGRTAMPASSHRQHAIIQKSRRQNRTIRTSNSAIVKRATVTGRLYQLSKPFFVYLLGTLIPIYIRTDSERIRR